MSSETVVIEAANVSPAEMASLGGKARSLVELGKLEPERVPTWFAVSAAVFAEAMQQSGVADDVAASLARLANAGPERSAVDRCVAELAPLLDKLALPKVAREVIVDAYARIVGDAGPGDVAVAVRSSALDEDGKERSFAGCLDTSLYVRGADDVCDAVVRCWRSAFSARSLSYRAASDALEVKIGVAVVVQRMITGTVSGVLFSADPTPGAQNRALVTSTWGLGEGVVSGRAHCDTFAVERSSLAVVERDVVPKAMSVVRSDNGGAGTREVEVDEHQRDQPSLTDEQLRVLAELGWRIEDAYGGPVDVEWTWNEAGPWVLQARPITAGISDGAELPNTGGARRLWDNSNIIESYYGVTTPLTYSFARKAYGIVYRLAFELLGTPPSELARYQPVFEQLIGLLHGRIYYNLESWYKLIQLLPAYKFNAEFMEQMMGVSESAGFDARTSAPVSPLRRYGIELPKLVASLSQLTYKFARSEKLVSKFFEEFGDAYAEFDEADLTTAGYDDVVSLYLAAEDRLLQRWQAPIVNDILAMIFFGALRKVLSSWGFGESSLHNDLLCGEGGLESTEPTRNLLRLMGDVRRDEALCALLSAEPADVIRERVESEPAFGWLVVRIAAHVERFGDRCVDELKLEEPTLRDDPTFLYAALKGYLAAPEVTVEEMEQREGAIRVKAETTVRASLRNPLKRRLFNWLLHRARQHVKNRENLRFARTRAFGLVRRLALAMGRRLSEAGYIDDVDDVFYLEIAELVAFSRGTATTTDLRGLVAVRRREFDTHRRASDPPERFWTEGPTYLSDVLANSARAAGPAATEGPAVAGTVMTGIGASPGRVRAPARLVTDPRLAALNGEILVANRTDPGWVPLFPSAKAILVERGSVLSHSAIVAREFGIPCVVGVREVLSRLRDGQLIEVDGSAGTVTVID